MPFVKREIAAPAKSPVAGGDDGSPLAALRSPDPEVRWNAARALGQRADEVPVLATALGAETVQRVREAMITALMRIGDEASVTALLPYLRAQDAGLRAAVIEALQALPGAISPFVTSLLKDDDSDVRILATELVRNMPAAEATSLLCALLEREQHANVCAAAIDVLTEVGTRDAVPILRACAARFEGTPFVPFAASIAIARLAGTES
jgi:HEAT repeat protein